MKPPTTVRAIVQLSGDIYSSVSVYPDRTPIWSLDSIRSGHRTGLTLHPADDASLAELDELADTVERDAAKFVKALRAEAARIRTNQATGLAKVAAAKKGADR
jgi:hypothetical protein